MQRGDIARRGLAIEKVFDVNYKDREYHDVLYCNCILLWSTNVFVSFVLRVCNTLK